MLGDSWTKKYWDQKTKRLEVERVEKWREWIDAIPQFSLPTGCSIKIVPPFSGVLARVMIYRGNASVSVYLDVDGSCGTVLNNKGESIPYFEIFPYKDSVAADYDVARVTLEDVLEDVETLQTLILESLEQQELEENQQN